MTEQRWRCYSAAMPKLPDLSFVRALGSAWCGDGICCVACQRSAPTRQLVDMAEAHCAMKGVKDSRLATEMREEQSSVACHPAFGNDTTGMLTSLIKPHQLQLLQSLTVCGQCGATGILQVPCARTLSAEARRIYVECNRCKPGQDLWYTEPLDENNAILRCWASLTTMLKTQAWINTKSKQAARALRPGGGGGGRAR